MQNENELYLEIPVGYLEQLLKDQESELIEFKIGTALDVDAMKEQELRANEKLERMKAVCESMQKPKKFNFLDNIKIGGL